MDVYHGSIMKIIDIAIFWSYIILSIGVYIFIIFLYVVLFVTRKMHLLFELEDI